MSGKYALIIGNTEYIDPGLAQLTAPGKDAEDFARVLKDQNLCAFDDVKVLLNQISSSVIEVIDEFFDQRKPDDLLVLYFSGHGVRDELGSLYLAFRNTIRTRLRSTAIKDDYIRGAMDQSRSKRQVVILDCCNSGAFPQGTKAEVGGVMGLTRAFQGYGRFVLTASDATQFAWEGNKVIGETDNSLFTHYLVKGLEGEADSDGDGKITVDELYDYTYEQISKVTAKQTPTKSASKVEGEIVLRQITRIEDIKPVALPEDLISEVEDTRPYVREAAVQKLEKILKGKNIGMARSAAEALEKIAADDNTTRRVAQLATQALASYRQVEQKTEETQRTKDEAERLATQKAEEERLPREKAETERKAKEEADRLAAQKAEDDLKAKAEHKTKEVPLATFPVEMKTEVASAVPQKKPTLNGRIMGFIAVAAVVVLSIVGLGIKALVNGGAATATQAPAATEPPATEAPATEAPAATEPPATQPPANVNVLPQGQELASAYDGKYAGSIVTINGFFTGDDAVKFEESVKEFETATGIDIQYTGLSDFENLIRTAVQGGSVPADIVAFPNPTLLSELAAEGKVIDLNTIINPDWLTQNYNQAWLEAATMQGTDGRITAGIWVNAGTLSLVFYPKKAFDDAGMTIPNTWNDLMILTDRLASGGNTPWCIGIESGSATGWTVTHWLEDMLLRTTSLENYDKLTRGELKFDSPEVRNAMQYVTDIWFNDAYVLGGRAAISSISFGDAPKPMFDNPPSCWLHRQGVFITSFFPNELTPGVDYDFFYLPPIDARYGNPVLGNGDIFAMFNNRPEVSAVIQYFSTGISVKDWVGSRNEVSNVSPHNDFDLDWYSNPINRHQAELLRNATAFRFDNLPVNAYPTVWESLTNYVNGSIDLDTALTNIDASWPR